MQVNAELAHVRRGCTSRSLCADLFRDRVAVHGTIETTHDVTLAETHLAIALPTALISILRQSRVTLGAETFSLRLLSACFGRCLHIELTPTCGAVPLVAALCLSPLPNIDVQAILVLAEPRNVRRLE